MRTRVLLACGHALVILSSPVAALECANAGAAPLTPPNDFGSHAATACGDGAAAAGTSSVAVGYYASAPGTWSSALGHGAYSAGPSSTALGNSDSSEDSSTAAGRNASSNGDYSIALGAYAFSAGLRSTALGSQATASNVGGVALGYLASAWGQLGTALGYDAYAGSLASTAIGYKAQVDRENAIVLGSIDGVNGAPEYADVAIGTTIPLAPLHVFRDDGKAQVLVEETSVVAVPRTLFRLASAGSNAKFEIDNTMAGVNWAFTNSGGDFRISRQGSGVIEFRVDNAGNAFVANDLEVGGNLFTNVLVPSDREMKRNIEAIDPEQVLNEIAALPVTAWEYTDRPGERHLGPMAQDFYAAFQLGSSDTAISVVDAIGVALASIKALEARNRELEAKNAKLEDRLALVEARITQLRPRTAKN